jgi:CRP/FNR family cyclic AMP-dependent transcriptional regulator
MAVTIEQLRRVPLFRGLNDGDLKKILSIGKEVRHEPGSSVVEADKSGVGFHLIVEGNAAIHVGDTQIASFGPGDYFGEMSLIDGKPRSATVTADGTLTTFAIPAWDFERLMMQHPSIMRAMLVALSGRIRAIEAANT